MGAAPILADGLVAGNCAAVLRDNDEAAAGGAKGPSPGADHAIGRFS